MEPTISAEFEKLINQALTQLHDVLPISSSFEHSGATKRSLDTTLLSRAARQHGLTVLPLSEQTQVITDGARTVGFHQNMAGTLTALDRFVTNNKELTKRVLREAGLPVARGSVVDNVEAAIECHRQLACPAVVKPLAGSNGNGITVGVVDEAGLIQAANEALAMSSRVLVEECITSVDLRVMVVRGQAVAAMMRVPANVQGDGVSTIRTLVARKNEYRAANAFHKFVPIRLTQQTDDQLAAQGLNLDSVLEPGRRVFLHYKANLSSGGDSVNITDRIHPDLLRLAERAMKCFSSADHGGVDILAERIDRAPEAQKCVICEINCNNDLPIHVFPLFGTSIDVAPREIGAHFAPLPAIRRLRRAAMGRVSAKIPHNQPTSWRSRQSRVAQTAFADGLTVWAGAAEALANPSVSGGPVPLSDSPRELDQLVLARVLNDLDGARVRVNRRLLVADYGDHELIFERSGRSIFAGTVGGRSDLLFQLFDAADLPACAAERFRPDELDRATALLRKRNGPWNLRRGGGRRLALLKHSFRRESALVAGWSKAAGGSSPLLLEQAADGPSLRLLMIESKIAGSLLHVPFALTGDGESTVEQLLESKVSARAAHPYFRHLPLNPNLIGEQNLLRRGLTSTTVLPMGERVQLSRSSLPEFGAETVGLTTCPVPGLPDLARAALELVGAPPVASVTLAARHGDARRGLPPWALAGLDPDPVIAQFAWPWCGTAPGEALYERVAQVVRGGACYRLTRTS